MASSISPKLTVFLGRLPLRGLLRFVLLLVVPAVAATIGLTMYAQGGREMETENAYVKAQIVGVSAGLAGRVIEVRIKDDTRVERGELLFRIDPRPYEIAVDKARATLDVVRTDVMSLRAEYRATVMETTEAQEKIAFLGRQLERQERLKEKGMNRADVYDEARHNLDAARNQLQTLRERASRALASLGGDSQLSPEKHPRYAEAQAALDSALFDLSRTQIKAPTSGVVSNMRLQAGEFVERGVPVFSLIESGPIWIEANFKETQLTHMQAGQMVRVIADAYPDTEWQGVVDAIAPATGAEFAVLPPQNATGNWVKVVQRIPVRVRIDQQNGSQKLRAGMTVTVAVDTERIRGLPRPIKKLVDAGYLPRFLEPHPEVARSSH